MTDTTQPQPDAANRPKFTNPAAPGEQLTARELFGPNFNGAVVEIDYELQSRTTKSFFRRDFAYVSKLLNALENYRTIKVIDHGKLDAAEAIVTKKLDNVMELVGKKAKESVALLEANRQAGHNIVYPRAMHFRAPIISPYAREYMEVLKHADTAYANLDLCFLMGLVDRKIKTETEALIRKAIRSISQTVQQQRAEMAKYVTSLRGQADDAESLRTISQVAGAEAASLVQDASEDTETAGSVSTLHDLEEVAKASGKTDPLADQTPSPESAVAAAEG